MTKLQLVWKMPTRLPIWNALAHRLDSCTIPIRIALVGKYCKLEDAYLSVTEALRHAATAVNRVLKVDWVEAEYLEEGAGAGDGEAEARSAKAWETVKAADGVLVPGGFGVRGVDGKVPPPRLLLPPRSARPGAGELRLTAARRGRPGGLHQVLPGERQAHPRDLPRLPGHDDRGGAQPLRPRRRQLHRVRGGLRDARGARHAAAAPTPRRPAPAAPTPCRRR
jgi:hypothetical protein